MARRRGRAIDHMHPELPKTKYREPLLDRHFKPDIHALAFSPEGVLIGYRDRVPTPAPSPDAEIALPAIDTATS